MNMSLFTVKHIRAELSGCSLLSQGLTERVKGQDQELKDVRKEVALLLSELGQTKNISSVIRIIKSEMNTNLNCQ